MERLFHSVEFPQTSRGFGVRSVVPNPSADANRAVSVVLPPGSKYWHDQRVSWERVQSREKGKPPRLRSQAVAGVTLQQAAYDQALRYQANLFELIEENRTLAAEVERLQASRESLAANLNCARAQGYATDAEGARREAEREQRERRASAARERYDEAARDVTRPTQTRGGSVLRRHREMAEELRRRLAAEAVEAAEAARVAAMPRVGPPGTASGRSGTFMPASGLDASLATPRHMNYRVAKAEEEAVLSYLSPGVGAHQSAGVIRVSSESSECHQGVGAHQSAGAGVATAHDTVAAAGEGGGMGGGGAGGGASGGACKLIFLPPQPQPLFSGYLPSHEEAEAASGNGNGTALRYGLPHAAANAASTSKATTPSCPKASALSMQQHLPHPPSTATTRSPVRPAHSRESATGVTIGTGVPIGVTLPSDSSVTSDGGFGNGTGDGVAELGMERGGALQGAREGTTRTSSLADGWVDGEQLAPATPPAPPNENDSAKATGRPRTAAHSAPASGRRVTPPPAKPRSAACTSRCGYASTGARQLRAPSTAVSHRVPDRSQRLCERPGGSPASSGAVGGGGGMGALIGGESSISMSMSAARGSARRRAGGAPPLLLSSASHASSDGGEGVQGVTVAALPLGTWYADDGVTTAAGLGLTTALELTLTCWGQMKRALDAATFRDMVHARLSAAGLLPDGGRSDLGRAAVTLHFPEGIPRRLDGPLHAPQLVVGVTVHLASHLLKNDLLLLTVRTHAEVLSRALGEATGVDSVTCRLATRPEQEADWHGAVTSGVDGAALLEQGKRPYVVFQRGIEVDPYAAVESDWMRQ